MKVPTQVNSRIDSPYNQICFGTPPLDNITAKDNQINKESSKRHTVHGDLDQSKQLQFSYQQGDDQSKQMIFKNQIESQIISMVLDKYNHYVIQCIMSIGLQQHKEIIARVVEHNKQLLCYKKFAYKIIQQLLSDQNCQQRQSLIKYIIEHMDQLKYDQSGNLIVSHLLEVIDDEDLLTTVIERLEINVLKYHQFGCLIVNKLIELSTMKYNLKQPQPSITLKGNLGQLIEGIILGLVEESVELSTKSYSNYIVQKMMIECDIETKKILLNDYLLPNFVKLSKDKYGSNVCEKVLQVALAYQLQNLWSQHLKIHFTSLVNDQYANYVIQTYYQQIELFSYVKEEFQAYLFDLDRTKSLNQNGKIVYRFVLNCNRMGQQGRFKQSFGVY